MTATIALMAALAAAAGSLSSVSSTNDGDNGRPVTGKALYSMGQSNQTCSVHHHKSCAALLDLRVVQYSDTVL